MTAAFPTVSPIILNRLDRDRLAPHIAIGFGASWPILHLQRLSASARVVEPRKIPRNVVTMRSRVTVRDPLWETTETYTLTYPPSPAPGEAAEAAFADGADSGDEHNILVTSPLGAALLGSREGEEVRWISPRGPRRVFVESIVYQPERAGRFDL